MRDTQRKGDIGVTQAIATFTRLGYDVSLPITESTAYDLIVDAKNILYRVQVRYWGGAEVDLRRVHSNSKGYVVKKTKSGTYDWLFVLKSTGEQYLIKQCLENRRSVRPSEKHIVNEGLL